MTLNELLKVIDDDARIQIRIKMFGHTFCTNGYKKTSSKKMRQQNFLRRKSKW